MAPYTRTMAQDPAAARREHWSCADLQLRHAEAYLHTSNSLTAKQRAKTLARTPVRNHTDTGIVFDTTCLSDMGLATNVASLEFPPSPVPSAAAVDRLDLVSIGSNVVNVLSFVLSVIALATANDRLLKFCRGLIIIMRPSGRVTGRQLLLIAVFIALAVIRWVIG